MDRQFGDRRALLMCSCVSSQSARQVAVLSPGAKGEGWGNSQREKRTSPCPQDVLIRCRSVDTCIEGKEIPPNDFYDFLNVD